MSSVYLDCNATTPLDPVVREVVIRFMTEEFGNAGSRTHGYGSRAKKAVESARERIAQVLACKRDEVIFTSGATESNNLAILGLAEFGRTHDRRHIISSTTEHKAVLEPLQRLEEEGFEVTYLNPTPGGWVDPESLRDHLREDTLLVSLMHVNNETGIVQPIKKYAKVLSNHPAYFHVDAAQGFGKLIGPLQDKRIDLMSISGHKMYAPKGIGALMARRRKYKKPPLRSLTVGGGQERGLRPGTLPVHLAVGLGEAAHQAKLHQSKRKEACIEFGQRLRSGLAPLCPIWIGDDTRRLYNTASLRFDGIDSEAVMVILKDLLSISNGSACTSNLYAPSHVMLAMGLNEEESQGVLRFSWYHQTESVNWNDVCRKLASIGL